MNTKHLLSIGFLVLVLIAVACSGKKENNEQTESSDQKEWKEMDEFHIIMAETFHPFKDSANLEPAKSRAGELVSFAEKWVNAPLPEKVNTDEMKEKLEQLRNESSALAQAVNTGDDKAIGEQLTKVHDLFHAIQEAWYGGGDDEHEHEHH